MAKKSFFLQAVLLTVFFQVPSHASREYDEIATEVPFGRYPYIDQENEPSFETETSYGDADVLIPRLMGLYFYYGDIPPTEDEKSAVQGVKFADNFTGLDFTDKRILQEQVSSAALYQPLTKLKLNEIRAIVANFYKNKDRPFVLVTVPEQNVTDQVVAISVIEAKLGSVSVSGNKWFSSDQYLKAISLKEGSVINSSTLGSDLTWINRNPFRTTNAVFKPGSEIYTTDVEIVADDYKPWQVYIGTDNTGFNVTDYGRLFIGLNWGNAFNVGHILSYQFTTSPDFHKFWSQTLNYTMPLPWRDLIALFGGYAKTHATSGPNMPANNTTGTSWQLSGRYVFARPTRDMTMQEWKVGLDYKRTNNDFIVGESVISNSLVSEFLIAGEYNIEVLFPKISLNADAQTFIAPGQLSDSMSKSAYNTLRSGADNAYIYTRLGSKAVFTLPMDFILDLKGRIQLSSGTLLPIEQFGLGGIDSVRGYVERAVNVDDALLLNIEARTPAISLFQQFGKTNKVKDALRGLIFFDVGSGWENNTIQGQHKWSTLAGIGPGLRYGITPWVNMRLDWGFALSKISTNYTPNRIYYSVIASY
jgi:hemolysin activation/secretion protein